MKNVDVLEGRHERERERGRSVTLSLSVSLCEILEMLAYVLGECSHTWRSHWHHNHTLSRHTNISLTLLPKLSPALVFVFFVL